MARSATVFTCSACGHESPKWNGRCPGCGEWNALVEEPRASSPPSGWRPPPAPPLHPVPLGRVKTPVVERLGTRIGEFDRVLGGGLVPGSSVLIGGSPGIGNPTLTTKALVILAAAGHY